MSTPLWEYLEKHGTDAVLEYGRQPHITYDANCASHATGNMLHIKTVIKDTDGRPRAASFKPGKFDNINNIKIFENGDTTKPHPIRLFWDLIASGAKFRGFSEAIPRAHDGHYICTVFQYILPYDPTFSKTDFNKNDFHLARGHQCDTWTERCASRHDINVVCKNPKTIFDLFQEHRYCIWHGWFMIPNHGLRGDVPSTITRNYNQLSYTEQKSCPKIIETITKIDKERERLLKDFNGNFDRLDDDFAYFREEFRMLTQERRDFQIVIDFLNATNQVKYPDVKHAPHRLMHKEFINCNNEPELVDKMTQTLLNLPEEDAHLFINGLLSKDYSKVIPRRNIKIIHPRDLNQY